MIIVLGRYLAFQYLDAQALLSTALCASRITLRSNMGLHLASFRPKAQDAVQMLVVSYKAMVVQAQPDRLTIVKYLLTQATCNMMLFAYTNQPEPCDLYSG